MAKAARLPKLRWVKNGPDHQDAGRFGLVRSAKPGLWTAYKCAPFDTLGYGRSIAAAKRIAQAFADAETLRGEPA